MNDGTKMSRRGPQTELEQLRAFVVLAVAVAMKRPHDGSQLDEDLEDLLLEARKFK